MKIRNVDNGTYWNYSTKDRLISYQLKSWKILLINVNILLNVQVVKFDNLCYHVCHVPSDLQLRDPLTVGIMEETMHFLTQFG